jgi:hypothetical protein
MANRHYQYISRRKLVAELPWLVESRTVRSKSGVEAGLSAMGGTATLSHVIEPVAESEATLVHWVEQLEEQWAKNNLSFPPPWEATDGQVFYIQTSLRRGGPPGWPGVWWGGVIEDLALVLTGSSVHLMGHARKVDDKDLWMSDLEEQWNTLVGSSGGSSHGTKWAVDCAVQFALGSAGGMPPQFVEACVLTNTVQTVEGMGAINRLILGSPYFVALLH